MDPNQISAGVNKYLDIIIELILGYAPQFILALVTLFVGFRLANMFVKMLSKALSHDSFDSSLASFLESFLGMSLKGLVVITVANMIGVEMTSFIALLGAAGLAVGLSLQGSLSNFAGGMLILLFKPFSVGDIIEAQGHLGRVDSIQISNTILHTLDNKTVIIPNGLLSNGVIENYSAQPLRRLDMVFGIGYNDDITKAKNVLLEVLKQSAKSLLEPAPLVAVGNLGASSVDIECRVWVKSEDYHALRFELNENVKMAFDQAGISFPYPQQDVHLYPTHDVSTATIKHQKPVNVDSSEISVAPGDID